MSSSGWITVLSEADNFNKCCKQRYQRRALCRHVCGRPSTAHGVQWVLKPTVTRRPARNPPAVNKKNYSRYRWRFLTSGVARVRGFNNKLGGLSCETPRVDLAVRRAATGAGVLEKGRDPYQPGGGAGERFKLSQWGLGAAESLDVFSVFRWPLVLLKSCLLRALLVYHFAHFVVMKSWMRIIFLPHLWGALRS